MSHRTFASIWIALSIFACTGTISDPQGISPRSDAPAARQGGGSGGAAGSGSGARTGSGGATAGGMSTGGAGGSGPEPCPGSSVDLGPSTMQLLTRDQYLNSVRDLLGEHPQLDTVFPAASAPATFGLVQGNVAEVDLEMYGKAAELVAAATVANGTKLDALAPCVAGSDSRGCARAFVQSFGSRAYRAPLSDATDVDRHLALYDLGAGTSYAHGIEMVLRGMLQAPRFLYRAEPGTDEKVGPRAVRLSGYELAARLSYALWNTMPDPPLHAAAANGKLATKEGVVAELIRMLADPRGKTAVRRFLEGWIHVSEVDTVVKDKGLFPDWGAPALRASLRIEAEIFFDDVLGRQGGRLSALLTADRGDGVAAGMLSLPALLGTLATATESSPIYRGKFVREQLLCQQLPAPPPNVPRPPDTQPGVSTREKFRQHEVDPACSGCHTLIDPIGFGFEHYDAVGRYRTEDNGARVDASGEVLHTRDINGKFTGVAELGKKLAASSEVEECVARQWFRYFLARFEQDADRCSITSVIEQFRAGGHDLNRLPLALVSTNAFFYRRPVDEVSP